MRQEPASRWGVLGDGGGVNALVSGQAYRLTCAPAIPDKDEVGGSSPPRPTTQTPRPATIKRHACSFVPSACPIASAPCSSAAATTSAGNHLAASWNSARASTR